MSYIFIFYCIVMVTETKYVKLVQYRNLVADIIKKEHTQSEIARKYGKTEGYVSQIAKKISQLRYPPEFDASQNIICHVCREPIEILHIHHKHATGEQIAILCHTCNLCIGDNDLSENHDFVASPFPGPEIISVPSHSIIYRIKFASMDDRNRFQNSPDFSKLLGELGVWALKNNGKLEAKISKR